MRGRAHFPALGSPHPMETPVSDSPAFPTDVLTIRPWPDPVIDALGFDPRSRYVEQFWLGILGPSTTWLLRRLAAGLEAEPSGFDLQLAETARALGLGAHGGRHSPFVRAPPPGRPFHPAHLPGPPRLARGRQNPPPDHPHPAPPGPPPPAAHEH